MQADIVVDETLMGTGACIAEMEVTGMAMVPAAPIRIRYLSFKITNEMCNLKLLNCGANNESSYQAGAAVPRQPVVEQRYLSSMSSQWIGRGSNRPCGPSTRALRMRGLPYNCAYQEIEDFFTV